jgi:hypothetical protein
MTRLMLLGIVAVAMFLIAPLMGASSSASADPDKPSSLLARPLILDLPGDEDGDRFPNEDSRRREERDYRGDREWRRDRERNSQERRESEERRERQREFERRWDEEGRDFFEDIFR